MSGTSAGFAFRVIVNLRAERRAVNYPLVVQWHGSNVNFFEITTSDSIGMNAAIDAGSNDL
jgi:hypothetical protein